MLQSPSTWQVWTPELLNIGNGLGFRVSGLGYMGLELPTVLWFLPTN